MAFPSMTSADMQPTDAPLGVCQAKRIVKEPGELDLVHRPVSTWSSSQKYYVDRFGDPLWQLTHLELMSVHINLLLWLRFWSAKLSCKKLLECMPFESSILFDHALDTCIKQSPEERAPSHF